VIKSKTKVIFMYANTISIVSPVENLLFLTGTKFKKMWLACTIQKKLNIINTYFFNQKMRFNIQVLI
jgi:hypothetical protein